MHMDGKDRTQEREGPGATEDLTAPDGLRDAALKCGGSGKRC